MNTHSVNSSGCSEPITLSLEVTEAVGVKRLAMARWELGESYPRRPHRAVYKHFLNRLAERYPEAAKADAGMLTPASGSRGSG